ncbi:hypothetical protein D3C86_2155510 [compost metagenome]
MFGTLYVTRSTPEVIHFGTGEQDHERYLTLQGLIVTPFVDIARKLFPAKRPGAQPESRSDPYFSAQSASVTKTVVRPQ